MEKLKNLFPALFSAITRWDRPRTREKNFTPEFRSYSTKGRKFRKKEQKNFKKLKNLFLILFLAKTGWDRPRKREKFYFRIPFLLDPGKKIPKKIAKKLKKLKNLFLTLFLAKTEWDRLRKREKNFTPEFSSCSTRARKFWKK